MTWDDLIDEGRRIRDIRYVTPGDVVFLENPDRGRLLAFTVTRVEHMGDRTTLWQSMTRNYTLGGASRLVFRYALREA